MDKNRKQQLIIALVIFISIVIVISIAVLVNGKRDTPVNTEVTSLQPASRQNDGSEVVPEAKSGIYGLGSLSTTKLATIQKNHIEFELKDFMSSYSGEKITYLTVNESSIQTSYNTARSANEIRFSVTSNSGLSYVVSGLYVADNDMYITVYDTKNNTVYFEPYDEGGE